MVFRVYAKGLVRLGAIALVCASVVAQNRSLPRFENYPVKERYTSKPVPVNLHSHPKARLFRTQLRDGIVREGVNFAGHYSIITWGCGSDCRMVAVVDARTGHVYFAPLTVSTGAEFRVNSRLFIANPSEIERYLLGEPMLDVYEPSWYVWTRNRLVRIHKAEAQNIRKKNTPRARKPIMIEDGSFPSTAIRKTEKELLALAVYRVEPSYPPIAWAAHASGEVLVQVVINEDGNVTAARVVSGHPLLQRAALVAARNWRFTPGGATGKEKVLVGFLTFRFHYQY